MVLLVSILGLAFGTGQSQAAWLAFKQWRAERFVDQAYSAWQSGRIRDAALAFNSALQMAPGHRRALHLQGRMFLHQQRRVEGRAVFARMLSHETGAARLETSHLYLEALLATGWFDELPIFCLQEIPFQPAALHPQFGFIALESLRISRLAPAAFSLRSGDSNLDQLIAARLRLNRGEIDAARAILKTIEAPLLRDHLRWAAVRLALEAGDRDQAWFLLQATRAPLAADELRFHQLWWDAVHEDLPPAHYRNGLAAVFAPETPAVPRSQRIGYLVGLRQPALSRALWDHFKPVAHALDVGEVSALWLQWEVSLPRDRTSNPWLIQLERRAGGRPINLDLARVTPATYLAIINSLPLSRESVIGLLSLVEQRPGVQPDPG